MIHQYKLSGYNIVLDVYSGSVHAVDDVAYDAIALIDQGSTREAATAQLEQKYRDRADVTPADISDCFDDIEELTAAGQLFAPDAYADHAFDFFRSGGIVTFTLPQEEWFAAQSQRFLTFVVQEGGGPDNYQIWSSGKTVEAGKAVKVEIRLTQFPN